MQTSTVMSLIFGTHDLSQASVSTSLCADVDMELC